MMNDPNTQKQVYKYVWTRPPVPRPTVAVRSYLGVKQVLAEPRGFLSTYDDRLLTVVQQHLVKGSIVSDSNCNIFPLY